MKPTHDDLVGFFMRHVVPVFFTFQKEDEPPKTMMMTAFVLSVGKQWFLVTAGHGIDCVKRIATEQGYATAACYLIDAIRAGAKHREPIPFAYARSHPTQLSKSKSFDYGVMALSPYYRELLEKNDVEALSEEVWKCEPSNPDFYVLLGIPGELVEVKAEHLQVAPVLLTVERVDKRPDGFCETEVPRFYGRIRLEGEISSIKGMSGGPIFAFEQDAQGQLRYWLVALQTSWLRNSHYIAGCPTRVLGQALEEFLVSLQNAKHL
ncbi:MAG TPA: hypothetical protein VMW58_07015 [Anaerolineae bacterium]|nr:hypothetical protein [Anaerolineae bacterium]